MTEYTDAERERDAQFVANVCEAHDYRWRGAPEPPNSTDALFRIIADRNRLKAEAKRSHATTHLVNDSRLNQAERRHEAEAERDALRAELANVAFDRMTAENERDALKAYIERIRVAMKGYPDSDLASLAETLQTHYETHSEEER